MIEFWFQFLAVSYLILGLDDLIIDFVFWKAKLKAQPITAVQKLRMQQAVQKPLAIMVASWQEYDVLRNMVIGNIQRIHYQNYHFFLGVYPNDEKTLKIAQDLSHLFPNVHVVINQQDGPTSKGQMVNEIVQGILRYENLAQNSFGAIMLHDCEDIIHPQALPLINLQIEKWAFLQLPIFSLPVSATQWVAGTYLNEFAESHTKDLLVRQHLGAAIPSAGVGTAIRRDLLQLLLEKNNGKLLNASTLTEDYELGVLSHKLMNKSRFLNFYEVLHDKAIEPIATRAYFPKFMWRSIKQKTRWTLGIAFQGAENLGWRFKGWNLFFLYRDRKGPVANILVLLGMLTILISAVAQPLNVDFQHTIQRTMENIQTPLWYTILIFNLILMSNRIVQRALSANRVYQWRFAIGTPIRVFISNIINAGASIRATYQYYAGKLTGIAPKWSKTEHELPEGFGYADVTVVSTDRKLLTESITTSIHAISSANMNVANTLTPSMQNISHSALRMKEHIDLY